VAGYVFGGLNLMAGCPWLVLGLANLGDDAAGAAVGIGAAHLAISAATVGIAVWAGWPSRRVTLAPTAAFDVGGRLTPGFGATIVGF
jgi:hypothetical protein